MRLSVSPARRGSTASLWYRAKTNGDAAGVLLSTNNKMTDSLYEVCMYFEEAATLCHLLYSSASYSASTPTTRWSVGRRAVQRWQLQFCSISRHQGTQWTRYRCRIACHRSHNSNSRRVVVVYMPFKLDFANEKVRVFTPCFSFPLFCNFDHTRLLVKVQDGVM